MEKWDIHDNSKRLKEELAILGESDLSQSNKRVIQDFINACVLENITPGRLKKYVMFLRNWADWLQADLDKVTPKEVEDVAIKLLTNQIKPIRANKVAYSEWTKRDYFATMKKFSKFLGKPELAGKIRLDKKPRCKYSENDLLTEDELQRIRSKILQPRDLCFFDMLEESGCRIGEIATLKIKDLTFDNLGVKVLVDGKTGIRPLRLCKSTASISKWLSIHPRREDPESYLFVKICKRPKPLTYAAFTKMLNSIFKEAKVTKKSSPHFAFRHRRATILAGAGWSEYELCQWMGWVIGSPEAATYVKQSGRHIEQAALRFAGLQIETPKDVKPQAVKCPRCELINEASAKFCSRCGSALDLKTAVTASEYNEKKSLVASQILERGIDLKTNEGKDHAIKIIEELKAKILLSP